MKSNWNYPTTMWVGENRIKDLGIACKTLNINKPLLVTDTGLAKSNIIINALKNLKEEGAKKLLGTNDYSTFRSSSCHAKSPIRTIKSIKIRTIKNKIEIEFKSQSFLQQQVRSMVGCLKYLGEKKWDLKTFDKVFKSKKRVLCAPPAPPEGLFLYRVIY